jgi:hypothetical protein
MKRSPEKDEFIRQSPGCKKCGESRFSKLSIDHIIPLGKGGEDKKENWQVLCRKCNFQKGVDVQIPPNQDAHIGNGHIIARLIQNPISVVGKISFGWNSGGTFSIVASTSPEKQFLINLRGEEVQRLKKFLDKVSSG